MAVIAPTIKPLGGGTIEVEWLALNAGDTGEWASLPSYRDKTFQMSGGPASAVIEGTLDPAKAAGQTQTLVDADNTTLLNQAAFAVAGTMKVCREVPLYFRPRVTTGAATVRCTAHL